MKNNSLLVCALLFALGSVISTGCSRSKVEVIDLNKVLDIYDKVVKSKEEEDPAKSESNPLAATDKEDEAETKAFLKLFADELNKAKLIKAYIGVEMLVTGTIRGFVDKDKNGKRGLPNSEPELFTLEFDTDANRIIATQKVAGQQYRRDHHYSSAYRRYYFYRCMHGAMWGRQNRYYSPSRPRPNYSSFSMSSPNYHTAAVSRARSVARSSSRSSSRSSARGFGRSGGFSGGK